MLDNPVATEMSFDRLPRSVVLRLSVDDRHPPMPRIDPVPDDEPKQTGGLFHHMKPHVPNSSS
jgi:hypothetical protein